MVLKNLNTHNVNVVSSAVVTPTGGAAKDANVASGGWKKLVLTYKHIYIIMTIFTFLIFRTASVVCLI